MLNYLIVLGLTASQALVLGHLEMREPPPRRSKFNPNSSIKDYNQMAPLNYGMFPCKGFSAEKAFKKYSAGSVIPVEFMGTANHNGGHCEFSLSYDNGKTFVVIKTILGDCLSTNFNYNIEIPPTAPPSQQAVFAWTWINKTGNREFYMQCADIEIHNPNPNSILAGYAPVVANLPECVDTMRGRSKQDIESCQVINGCQYIPEFPFSNRCDGNHLFNNRPLISTNSRGKI